MKHTRCILAFTICVLLLSLTAPMALAKKSKKTDAPAESEFKLPDDTDVKTPRLKALDDYNQGIELFRAAQQQGANGDTGGQERILKDSAKKFESALKIDPTLLEAQSNLGFVYLTMKKYKDAVTAFNAALLMNENHLNSLNGLATTYAFNNQTTESIVTFDKLTTLAPANADYLFNMGAVLQKAGRIDDARVVYEKALKINPHHQRALFNMGTLLENEGKPEEALPFYDRAKGAEIGNTVGLEALHRIDAIKHALKNTEQGPEPPTQKDSKKKAGKK